MGRKASWKILDISDEIYFGVIFYLFSSNYSQLCCIFSYPASRRLFSIVKLSVGRKGQDKLQSGVEYLLKPARLSIF